MNKQKQISGHTLSVSTQVKVTKGFRKGSIGIVVGEERTPIGPMLRVDFGDSGCGLIPADSLRII